MSNKKSRKKKYEWHKSETLQAFFFLSCIWLTMFSKCRLIINSNSRFIFQYFSSFSFSRNTNLLISTWQMEKWIFKLRWKCKSEIKIHTFLFWRQPLSWLIIDVSVTNTFLNFLFPSHSQSYFSPCVLCLQLRRCHNLHI